MREIKFRAWDKISETMYHGIHNLDRCNEYLNRPNEYISLQYTGLKDKNGKEIYEGDMIKATKANPYWYSFSRYKGIGGNYVMEFWEGSFTFMRGQCIAQDTIEFMGIEIIGNIYENSELLKGAK